MLSPIFIIVIQDCLGQLASNSVNPKKVEQMPLINVNKIKHSKKSHTHKFKHKKCLLEGDHIPFMIFLQGILKQ